MFVALHPSGEAQADLAAALAEVRDRMPTGDWSLERWIPPERWHITLAFLAHVDPNRLDRLTAALAEVAAAHSPVEGLRLAGAGSFGSTMWVGVHPTERGSRAERLAKAVKRAVRATGIDVERRPWRAHLSFARVRGDRAQAQEASTRMRSDLADYRGPAWTADRITLVQSTLGPTPQHTPVASFTMAG